MVDAIALKRLSRPVRRLVIKLGFDACLAFTSVWIAFLLQFQFAIPNPALVLEHAGTFAALYVSVAATMGLHRAIWRYTAIADLLRLAETIAITLVIFVVYQFIFRRELFAIPTLMAIHAMVFGGMVCGHRLLHRAWYEGLFNKPLAILQGGSAKSRLLLVGDSAAADTFIKNTVRNPNSPYEIVGFIDTDSPRVGDTFHGVPFVGTIQHMAVALDALVADQQAPQRVVFTSTAAMRHIPTETLTQLAETYGFSLGQLPSTTTLQDASAAAQQRLKPIAIEDLLGRPQAHVNLAALSTLIKGKRILVTGAGGSIGSELCRQIAAFAPETLCVCDLSEYNLYRIDQDLTPLAAQHGFTLITKLVDIRSADMVAQVFDAVKPQVVFHAAALKHVPMVELNPAQGVLTNIIGTRIVAEAAQRVEAEAFVQISTDKAVNPTNVMGATKRLGEYYAQALDLAGGKTRFVTVRFGNVLGSSGSVVPLFRRQLEQGGPLTVTHADIKRFFMTVQEAVALVLQASSTALTDEKSRGLIHVLDMGEPIRIVDIARQMIRLADLRPDIDVKIEIVGLRPGEKLYEELFDDREQRTTTSDPAILAATTAAQPLVVLNAAISDLETAARANDENALKAALSRIVPGYATA